jgi:hypothetical protein
MINKKSTEKLLLEITADAKYIWNKEALELLGWNSVELEKSFTRRNKNS